MTATAQLPPVTLGTLDGYPVMRWMDMQAWAGNFQGMQWVHLLIDAYVGSYGHYFTVNGDIIMLLDPALWEKFQISMASQPGTLVPVDSCTINGVIIKPYGDVVTPDTGVVIGAEPEPFRWPSIVQAGETTCSLPNNGKTYQIQAHPQESLKVMDHSGNLIMELRPGESATVMAPKTTVEVEIGEYERLKAVERAYNTLRDDIRAGRERRNP